MLAARGKVDARIGPFVEPLGQIFHRAGISLVEPLPQIRTMFRRPRVRDANQIKPQRLRLRFDLLCQRL